MTIPIVPAMAVMSNTVSSCQTWVLPVAMVTGFGALRARLQEQRFYHLRLDLRGTTPV
jgi:hypothetical protein